MPGSGNDCSAACADRENIALFGTAIAFLDFFEWLGDRSLALPAGSLAIETGGYKGTRRDLPKEDLYALFTAKLGLSPDDMWNEYGMTELSSQFYTQGLRRPHHGAPWVRASVLDPETGREVRDGQTGVLRIWDLRQCRLLLRPPNARSARFVGAKILSCWAVILPRCRVVAPAPRMKCFPHEYRRARGRAG